VPATLSRSQLEVLAGNIRRRGLELGFQQVGFSDLDLSVAGERLRTWLALGYHGEMSYMERHGQRRSRPAELLPGTASVITARMDYLPAERQPPDGQLDHASKAYVSRYALGRDYHKTVRHRLAKLARAIEQEVGPMGHRAFVDSAPVMEKPLAEKAGLGWIGKHTNLINRDAGSWFFLGEIYVDIALPPDVPETSHCGSCRTCIDVCPTNAIVAPYQLDARRCISYLTIELDGPIPTELRESIGNRIYGCDDCQLFCPWNKFASPTAEGDFAPRHGLDDAELTDLFGWDEQTWLTRTEGSAIRRIGYTRWLRNIAVALGNAQSSDTVVRALEARMHCDSEMLRDHVQWALERHRGPHSGRHETG